MTKRLLLSCAAVLTLAACAGDAPDVEATADAPATQTEPAAPAIDPTLAALKQRALDEQYGYAIVEGLTTEIGQRLAGTEAEARARDWTVAKFEEIGLQNVRVEPFTIPGWERGVETASIVSPFPQEMLLTALGGSVATPRGGVEAPVVFFPTYDDLEGHSEDLSGKIVYIGGRMEKAPDGAGYGPANRKRRSGATEGAKRGALAVVIRSVGTDSHRFPHTGQMRYDPDHPRIPIAALSAPDADQLERMFERGQDIVMRVNVQPITTGDQPSGNVIGEIVGTERPEEIVLIGGHLDSWDLGTGAVDDGAGIGVSAGAAQAIIEAGIKPKRTIRVVAFGAEEVGLLGAYAYAEKHKDAVGQHVLATESDFGAEAPYEVHIGSKSGHDVIREAARIMDLPAKVQQTSGGPDIIPLAMAGVPTMRFQQDGTDYFDLHHTPDDTLDKIDPEQLAINTAAFAVMAVLAANAETDFRTSDSASGDTQDTTEGN